MKLLKGLENFYSGENLSSFLQNNLSFGTEDIKDEPNLFHAYWFGPFLPIHKLCIKSLLATQNVDKIIIWVPNLIAAGSSRHIFKGLNIEVQEFSRDIFNQMNVSQNIKDLLYSKYITLINFQSQPDLKKQYAYASDIFRFVILNVFGGIYFDMDNVFLRNLNDIKISRWVSQWGTDPCGSACVMRLEKGHDLIVPIVKSIEMPFYPTTTFKLENSFDITILPGDFFDPLWKGNPPEINEFTPFNNFDDFFKKTPKTISKENFFKGSFTYHWHNRWDLPIEENSPYSQLLSQF